MLVTSQGRIFPGAERSKTEIALFRTLQCLRYSNELTGSLYLLNDETLGGGSLTLQTLKEDKLVVLLPVVSGVLLTEGNETSYIEAGQVHRFHKKAGKKLYCTIHMKRNWSTICSSNFVATTRLQQVQRQYRSTSKQRKTSWLNFLPGL